MTSIEFERLLDQADEEARQENWQACLETLSQAIALDPEHVGAISGQGTCLIQMNRPSEAVPFFRRAVELKPDSTDAYNNLGIALALSGQFAAAESAYQKAANLDPDDAKPWKNLAMLYLQANRLLEGVQILAAVLKNNPRDVDALFILAQCYEEAEDYNSARDLYQEVLKNDPDHRHAREALERIPQAAPDLSRIARPEHASKLAALKGLKSIRKDISAGDRLVSSIPSTVPAQKPMVAFLGPPEAATETRLGPVVQAMLNIGCSVKVGIRLDPADLPGYDTWFFSRPHASDDLLIAIEQCCQAGKRVIIDLDEDFHHLPADYAGYDQFGPGNPSALKALEKILGQANMLTVPSPVLAERYQKFAHQVKVVPDIWSRANPLWDKPTPRRDTLQIGMVGTHVHPRDAALLKADLTRLMREYRQLLLTIGVDLRLYDSLGKIPEDRHLFLPAGRLEDYPYTLANYDILLIPLQDIPFNQAKSDLPLLEAGIRRIPWVASPIPAFRDWLVGGMFAEKDGDWYAAIKKLIGDPDLRESLGNAGRQKAETRESTAALQQWLALFDYPGNSFGRG